MRRGYLKSDSYESGDEESSEEIKLSFNDGTPEVTMKAPSSFIRGQKTQLQKEDEFHGVFGSNNDEFLSARSKKIVNKQREIEEAEKRNSGKKIHKKELNPDLARIRDLDEDDREKAMLDFYEKQVQRSEKGSDMKQNTAQRFAHQQRMMDKCGFCPESAKFSKERSHEIFSMSSSMEGVYCASVGWRHAVHAFHSRIVPLVHKPSVVTLDEDTYDHMRNAMKRCVRFLKTCDMTPIFVEVSTSTPSKEILMLGGGNHLAIEVFPIPTELLDEAQMKLHQLLSTAGEEWSQHKKIIDTQGVRNAPRGIIPPNIPYVHVDFALQGGFGHVVENRTDDDFQHTNLSIAAIRETLAPLTSLDYSHGGSLAGDMFKGTALKRIYKNNQEWRDKEIAFRKKLLEWGGDPDLLKNELEATGDGKSVSDDDVDVRYAHGASKLERMAADANVDDNEGIASSLRNKPPHRVLAPLYSSSEDPLEMMKRGKRMKNNDGRSHPTSSKEPVIKSTAIPQRKRR